MEPASEGVGLADLTPQEYLQRFHVNFYLEDLVTLFLSRRRGSGDGSRNTAEFIERYFDSVLRGEHIINRSFGYINSTPLNRRSFVALLRSTLAGIEDASCTALTACDFHDFLVALCGDFPLALIEEAAQFAQLADPLKDCLIGECTCIGVTEKGDAAAALAEQGDNADSAKCLGDNDKHVPLSNLLLLSSLQQLVELHFVYAEVVTTLKHLFRSSHPKMEGAGDWRNYMITRSMVVAEIRGRVRDGTLSEEFLPSERALSKLLGDAGQNSSVATFGEILQQMTELFQVVPDPFPEGLLDGVGENLLPDNKANETGAFLESGPANLKGLGGAKRKVQKEEKKSSRR